MVRKLQGWASPAGLTHRSEGHSDAILTATHALVANACVDADGVYVFEKHAGRLREAAARFNHSDFYCANGRSVSCVAVPLRSSNASLDQHAAKSLPHLAVVRPRDSSHLAFLQAIAPLLRVATHPEQFPQVHSLVASHA